MASRTELVAWLNDLLQISYTKVEQCGTGAAYCQVIDSVYGDVPMSKVKMNAKQEYEYIANFKVLQNIFKAHGIDKPIPVQGLVKCKMQDNLEFLQWLKKYWDLHFPGGEYDAVARRKGLAVVPDGTTAARSARSPINAAPSGGARSVSSALGAKRPPAAAAAGPGRSAAAPRSASTVPDAALQALTAQMAEMKVSVEGLEKERDFYFAKLRDIEILIGARLESVDEGVTDKERDLLLQMQAILYSTEEGFEVPEDGVEAPLDDEETF